MKILNVIKASNSNGTIYNFSVDGEGSRRHEVMVNAVLRWFATNVAPPVLLSEFQLHNYRAAAFGPVHQSPNGEMGGTFREDGTYVKAVIPPERRGTNDIIVLDPTFGMIAHSAGKHEYFYVGPKGVFSISLNNDAGLVKFQVIINDGEIPEDIINHIKRSSVISKAAAGFILGADKVDHIYTNDLPGGVVKLLDFLKQG